MRAMYRFKQEENDHILHKARAFVIRSGFMDEAQMCLSSDKNRRTA